MDDTFDLENDIQTKAEFSSAIAVMEKDRRLGRGMWICTKTVICNGQNHMQNSRLFKFKSIIEAVKWVCDDALDEHVWVSELTISCGTWTEM